jgi:pSer/pThr/pTyr-binding forkhead associated (FHA) protein
MLGRGLECPIRFSGKDRDCEISRQHCQLVFDPPIVRIRDMDSTNGTYLNGRPVGVLEDDPSCTDEASGACHGDILTVGGTSMRVDIVDCAEDLLPEPPHDMSIRVGCQTPC